jgi:flagellin
MASDTAISVVLGSTNTDTIGGNTFSATGRDGDYLHLRDIHTATSSGVQGVGDGTWQTGAGAPPAYSYTDKKVITYSGKASLLVNDSKAITGLSSKASNAIAIIDGALSAVTNQRSAMGAKANQFDAVVRNLSNIVETTSASRSRIMDADFAAETANLTKAMIMQQSGISVLSQANTLPQSVLALLK